MIIYTLLLALLTLLFPPAAAQLDDFFGNVTCLPGEYEAEIPYEDTEGVNSGWGNCHEPEVGGKGAKGKRCYKAWIDKENDEWDWRCACHNTFPLTGPDCDEPNQIYWVIIILWLIPMFYDVVLCSWGYKVCKTMFKFSNNKVNAANTSCGFMVLLTGSEFCRFTTWILRAVPGSYEDEFFRHLQFFNTISAISVCEGMMGLALAWLDIAVKSSSGKGKTSHYKRR